MTNSANRPADQDDETNKKEQNAAGEHPPYQEKPADITPIRRAAAHSAEKGKFLRSLLSGAVSGLVRGAVGDLPIDLPLGWPTDEEPTDD